MLEAQPFEGVLAPVLTPFNDDLSVAKDLYVAHAKWLLDEGCTGLAPFGTTSEANSLGLDERMEMLELLVSSGIPAKLLMPGTGTCALPDTIRLTKHAVEFGCGGVLLLPPFYYKGVSDDGVFEFVSSVIEEVGSDDLRIYCYHIPPIAKIGYSTELLVRLRDAFPGVVIGTKDSSAEWDNTLATHEALPEFGTFVGSESLLLDNLRAGGVGCITATANVNARAIRALVDGWQGKEAEALNAEICAYRAAVQQYPPIPAMKWLLADNRAEPRWRNVRPPLMPLSDEDGEELKAALHEL